MDEDDGSLLFNELMGLEPPSPQKLPSPLPATAAYEDDEEFFQDFSPDLVAILPEFPNPRALQRPPEKQDAIEFHPLGQDAAHEDKITLEIARRLLASGPFCLSLARKADFLGSGVYCLEGPIPGNSGHGLLYVGKSQHNGRRKGLVEEDGFALCNRLKHHFRSVNQTTIDPRTCSFRFVVLPPHWVSFAEHKLIELFRPVWNVCLEGFGSNPQGSRRDKQQVSSWDTWYPGRPIPETAKRRDRSEVEKVLEEHLPGCLHTSRKAYERIHAQDQKDGSPGTPSPALDARREALGWGEASLPGHVRQRGFGDGDPAQQEATILD